MRRAGQIALIVLKVILWAVFGLVVGVVTSPTVIGAMVYDLVEQRRHPIKLEDLPSIAYDYYTHGSSDTRGNRQRWR